MNTFIGVDYDEFKPETFRAFFVRIGERETRFDDWESAVSFAEKSGNPVMRLSSVDNFASDLDQSQPTAH